MRDPSLPRSGFQSGQPSVTGLSKSKAAEDDDKIGRRRFSTVALEHAALPYRPASPDFEAGEDDDSTIGDEDSDMPHSGPGRFIGVIISYGDGVGLFSLWRFPAMLVKHGGAFIIAYITVACLIGMPLQQLETSVGEFTRLGPFGVWGCSRMMQGIGIASVFLSTMVALLSSAVTVWFMYYCFSSMSTTLPWDNDDMEASNWTLSRMPQDFHFWKKVTDANTGFTDKPEVPDPNLILCSLALYVTVALSLGRKLDRKRTSLKFLPGLLSTVAIFGLFFTTTSRNGAMKGVESAFSITWANFQDPRLWIDALVQLFFSFGCGTGVHALQAARRPYKAASILALGLTFAADLLTGTIAGLTVCMALSEFSAESGDVVATVRGFSGDGTTPNLLPGPGVSIVAYTYALSHLHGAQIWSVLFFGSLSLTGYRTVCPCVRVVSTFLLEKMGKWESRDRIKIAMFVSLGFALVSTAFFTKSGPHLVCLFENFAMSFGAPVVAIAECVALCVIYGSKQWAEDLAGFTGSERSVSTAVIWKYITPISLLVQITADFVSYDSSDEAAVCAIWTFPRWVQILGWALASTPVFLIIFHMASTYLSSTFKNMSLKELFAPTEEWSPAEETFYWLMRNLGGKYHVLPDPIILVNLHSLDSKGPLRGIPHGYAVERDLHDSSHLHTNPFLQRRILELLHWDDRRLQPESTKALSDTESAISSPRRQSLREEHVQKTSSVAHMTVTDSSASIVRRDSSAGRRRPSAFLTVAEISRRAIEASPGSPEKERLSKGARRRQSGTLVSSVAASEPSVANENGPAPVVAGSRTGMQNSSAKPHNARMLTIPEIDRPRRYSSFTEEATMFRQRHGIGIVTAETNIDASLCNDLSVRNDSSSTTQYPLDLADHNTLSTKSLPAPLSSGISNSLSSQNPYQRTIIGWTGSGDLDVDKKEANNANNEDVTIGSGIENIAFESD